MYVAKLGGMYLEKIGLIGWTTNIGSVKFTSNRVKAMTFKSISDDHSLIIKQTKKWELSSTKSKNMRLI